jgi:hypothetical protein
MNKADQTPSFSPVTRRTFLRNGAILTAGVAALSLPARAQVNKNSKLRIFQVGVGGIGGRQRGGLKGHPQVEWAGFCDVDRRELDNIKKEHPNAWTTSEHKQLHGWQTIRLSHRLLLPPARNSCSFSPFIASITLATSMTSAVSGFGDIRSTNRPWNWANGSPSHSVSPKNYPASVLMILKTFR